MNIAELVKSTLQELQDLMATKTVVGEPVNAGKHTVIPVSKVVFGFGSGGGHGSEAKKSKGDGEGIGGGWSIEPVAFVIIGEEGVKLLTIGSKESVTTKLFDLAPKVMETVKEYVDKKSAKSTTEEKGEPEPDK